VACDAVAAGLAEFGVGAVDLLDHGADQAGEVGQVALDEGFAQVDVGEQRSTGSGMTDASL